MKPTDRYAVIRHHDELPTIFDARNAIRDIIRAITFGNPSAPKMERTDTPVTDASGDRIDHKTRYTADYFWNGSDRPLAIEASLAHGMHRPVLRVSVTDLKSGHVTGIAAPLRLDQANLIKPAEDASHLLVFLEECLASIANHCSPYDQPSKAMPVTLDDVIVNLHRTIGPLIHAHQDGMMIDPGKLYQFTFAKPFGLPNLSAYMGTVNEGAHAPILGPLLAAELNNQLPELVAVASRQTSSGNGFSLGTTGHGPFTIPKSRGVVEDMKVLARFASIDPADLFNPGVYTPVPLGL